MTKSITSRLRFLGITAVLFVSGCAAPLNNYVAETPALHLDRFFNGELVAYGMVQDYSGQVTRRFKAELVGRWEGNQGVLDERFEFDDGEVDFRCWRLEKEGNQYRGTAGDVVGEAKGETQGNALNWQYVLSVPLEGRTVELKLDDWMYLIDEQRLINRADMTFYGLTVGELTLYIEKVSNNTTRQLGKDCQ